MIPVLLVVLALLVGLLIGTRRTRTAVRTTDGRRRHGLDRQVITGEIAVDPHEEMTAALRTAQTARTTFSLPAGPVAVHPETRAIPRVDGSLPTRPPAPRIDGSIRRGMTAPRPAPHARRHMREWDTRA